MKPQLWFKTCAMSAVLVILLLAVVDVDAAPAAEWHVCAAGPPACDFATVQAAVDAAANGDVIKVAAGAYTDVHTRDGIKQIVHIVKPVSILGGFTTADWDAQDPLTNQTKLDAQGMGRVVFISGTFAAELSGLHITGGDATGLGGGIWGTAWDAGGGVYVHTAVVNILNCDIYDNIGTTDASAGGGAVALVYSPSRMQWNRMYDNVASSGGWGEGGAVAVYKEDAVLVHNTIRGNIASSGSEGIGGGIYLEGTASTLQQNIFLDNTASQSSRGDGGAIYVGPGDSSQFENTVVVGNRSGAGRAPKGAGVFVEVASPSFKHTTFSNNTGGDGAGITVVSYNPGWFSEVRLSNSIFAGQSIGVTGTTHSEITVAGVLWHGNGQNTDGNAVFTITGVRSGDPRFAADGYHLRKGSAAIDEAPLIDVTRDVDGQARPNGLLPDLGADEYYPGYDEYPLFLPRIAKGVSSQFSGALAD